MASRRRPPVPPDCRSIPRPPNIIASTVIVLLAMSTFELPDPLPWSSFIDTPKMVEVFAALRIVLLVTSPSKVAVSKAATRTPAGSTAPTALIVMSLPLKLKSSVESEVSTDSMPPPRLPAPGPKVVFVTTA